MSRFEFSILCCLLANTIDQFQNIQGTTLHLSGVIIYISEIRSHDYTILFSSFLPVSLLSIQIIRNNTIWRSLHRYNVVNNVTSRRMRYLTEYSDSAD